MAKTLANAKVGDRVYRPFEILKPGKVIDIVRKKQNPYSPNLPHKEIETFCIVRWLDGSVSEMHERHLNDFSHAMEDHKKKYDKFKKIAQEVDGL